MKLGGEGERGQVPWFIYSNWMIRMKRSWNSKTHGRRIFPAGMETEDDPMSPDQPPDDQALQQPPQPHLHLFGLRPEVR